ncbi:hypothetical protein GEM_4630 [Burkholderia cepacia GG4]|uniref:Uncharacterized protein n=1 Tax=Burkholderia cepacia GG4 TaxID=1009846 RepID=A0A9W3K6C4_BURCE|nr:hypothetical protein GEM_4630 [Burkholderia cepacia GG4]
MPCLSSCRAAAMRVAAGADRIARVSPARLGNGFSPGLVQAFGLRGFGMPVRLPARPIAAW